VPSGWSRIGARRVLLFAVGVGMAAATLSLPATSSAAIPARSAVAVPEAAPGSSLVFTDATHGFWTPDPSVTSDYGGVLWATADGGRQWHSVLKIPTEISAFDFVNDRDGWVYADLALMATINGGARWTTVDANVGVVRTVQFVGPRLGYLSLQDGTVLVSRDGGVSWNPLGSSAFPTVTSACFTAAGWGFEARGSQVAASADDGRTWQARRAVPGAAPGAAVASLACTGASGWALLTSSGGAPSPPVWATRLPSGAWRPVSSPVLRGTGGAGAAAVALSGGDGLVVAGGCGSCAAGVLDALLAGPAGGLATDTVASSPSGFAVAESVAAVARRAWVVVDEPPSGSDPTAAPATLVLASADDGRTWQPVYTGP
jgi:photosystem II stability/assembly factor-like uncharacterized protein